MKPRGDEHWGFRHGEVPRYGKCRMCGFAVRADRLDLILEHLEKCPGVPPPDEILPLPNPRRRRRLGLRRGYRR
jgi:hypothetical protein